MRNNIYRLAVTLLICFVILAVTPLYWQVVPGEKLLARYDTVGAYERERRLQRGRIFDRAGRVLAHTEMVGGAAQRVYHYPALVATIGIYHPRAGATGIELTKNDHLRGLDTIDSFTAWKNRLFHRVEQGDDITLTLDLRLQQLADAALGTQTGAIVLLNSRTGEILALASHPYPDPQSWGDDADEIRRGAESMVNRAAEWLYPPGATLQTLTLAAALETRRVQLTDVFTDEDDFIIVNRVPIRCGNHPEITSFDLAHAYAYQCKTTFAQLGLQVGAGHFETLARGLGFDTAIPLAIEVEPSRLTYRSLLDDLVLAQTASGDGESRVTALQMALVAATIANEGVRVTPRLLPDAASNVEPVIASWAAPLVKEAMVIAVEEGWAQAARLSEMKVAGQIGAAAGTQRGELPAWFIGFAPADAPQYAIAVVVDNEGEDPSAAAVMASEILRAALRNDN